jgi:two-component system OmpR family sensor kinase
VPKLSLRARLVLGVLVLAAAGLLAADAFTYASLRSFLLDRVDRTLADDHRGFQRFGPGPGPRDRDGPRGDTNGCFSRDVGIYVVIRASDGSAVCRSEPRAFPGTTAPSPPRLPATFDLPDSGDGFDRATYLTVPAESGGDRYRVRASVDPGSSNVLVLATSLRDLDGTLDRLFWIEALVTAAVLAAIVLLGLWIVRLGLRPLAAIGRTAEAIAEGDLSHRVERAESRTEVGRLGLALNSMLDRIEASDQRLRRFVADASHELRTPLAAVRAYAELFTRGASSRPDDLERVMKGITRESERMSSLVEDLLLLARLDEGRPLERQRVRLDELAAEAVETARAVDPSHPIDLRIEPVAALGDHARLRQVVDNLLGNARSHTPAGTHVHVRVARDDGAALIEVADEGPGMSPEQADRAFERFYRADPSRSRDSGGVGLGLAIVSAVTEAHGGAVTVDAAAGRGTTFRVRLPIDTST